MCETLPVTSQRKQDYIITLSFYTCAKWYGVVVLDLIRYVYYDRQTNEKVINPFFTNNLLSNVKRFCMSIL